MALADLAKFNTKKPISLRDISLRQGISLLYLEQIFLKLKKNKIVVSARGMNGGYNLNKDASEEEKKLQHWERAHFELQEHSKSYLEF